MIPSSFCTICTHPCYKELIGLLLSLSLYHPNATMYCMVDSKTREEIDMWNKIKDLGFIDSWRKQNPEEDSIYS